MDYFDIEKYDRAVDRMIRSDYPIPDEFDGRVESTIRNLKAPRRMMRYMAAAAAALLLIVFVTLNLVPSVAAYASGIPGLDAVVDWLVINKGEENALKHGYPCLGPVTVEKNGFIIRLEDIFIDDESIRLSAKLKVRSENSRSSPVSFLVTSNDFDLTASISESPANSEIAAQKVEIYFRDENILAGFLENNPGYLSFRALISEDNGTQFFIDDIRVPLEKEKILLSRRYELSETLDLKYGTIYFKHLKVSPTRMVVEAFHAPREDYTIQSFLYIYLKDSEGNIYEPSGATGVKKAEEQDSKPMSRPNLGDNWTHCYYFVPSIYFEEKMPEKLYFCFEGLEVGSLKNTSSKLSTDGIHPRTVWYLDNEVTIEDFAQYDNTLMVTVEMPDNYSMPPDSVFVNNRRCSVTAHEAKDTDTESGRRYVLFIDLFINGVPEKESYEIDFCGYHIDASGEVELVLKP